MDRRVVWLDCRPVHAKNGQGDTLAMCLHSQADDGVIGMGFPAIPVILDIVIVAVRQNVVSR